MIIYKYKYLNILALTADKIYRTGIKGKKNMNTPHIFSFLQKILCSSHELL